ncbi:MAG TPA: substrate-binding domain-containing protein [Acetobacteraceae bacterium]|nr:substrate-binding domain-containing protein [Acetobacteraceae bacterium]
MTTRKCLLLAAAIAAGAALATGPARAEEPTYGVVLKTLSNPFWDAMAKGIAKGGEEAQVQIFQQAAKSDQDAETQLNICNTMLERHPKALIASAINSTNLLPCMKSANERGIPVVDLDANLDPTITAKAGVKIAFTIGSDNVQAGMKAADFMAEHLGKDAKGPVLVIEGLPGNVTGQKRAQGFKEELAKVAPGLHVVASLPGDWDANKAANITNDTLQRNPDLVAIFACNDTMALGAVETVFAAGKGKQVTVVGVDGTTDGVKSIKEGRLTATVAQLPYLEGIEAVTDVKDVLAGKSVPGVVHVPTVVLTASVLEQGTNEYLKYVK